MKPIHIIVVGGGLLVLAVILMRGANAPQMGTGGGATAKAVAPPATPIVVPSNPLAGKALAFTGATRLFGRPYPVGGL